jgi:hypothetical protein
MANPPSDRDEMRKELRDLATLAKATTREPNYFTEVPDYRTSGECSGFVDLSAFSASEPQWVEQELARARTPEVAGAAASASAPAPAPAPTPTPAAVLPAPRPPAVPRAIDQLIAESLSPVALASLLEQDAIDTQSKTVGGIGRRRGLVFVLGGVAVASVLLIAAAATRGASQDPSTQAAAPPTTTAAAGPTARGAPSHPAVVAHRTDVMRDAPTSRGGPAAAVAVAASPARTPSPAPTTPAPRRWSASPPLTPAVAAAPKRDRTPPKPSLAVVIPPSKAAAGDPLVAAVQQSIGGTKTGKRP